MAENQLLKNDRIREEARTTDWASLLARAVDDVTRIVHSEFRLLVAGLKTVMDEETERIFAFIATGLLTLGGGLCLLAAVIMFLREVLLLPWWQSFGITALMLFTIAVAIRAAVSRRAPSLSPDFLIRGGENPQ